jgi:phosphatidylinositol alpha-1,6-mannosyltransferase
MGTIYRFSGLDTVIRDLPILLQKHPGARLLIVGWGEDELRLKALAQETGVSANVIFTGLQPYSLLPDLLRSADVCINPFELNAITRDILPNKLFQYLASGRPLLATPLPGTLPFLQGEDQGVVYSELQNFVQELSKLLGDSDRCRSLGRNAELYTRRNLDWREIAAKMVTLMQEMSCA